MSRQVTDIAGYTYGTRDVAESPVSLEELEQLKQTVALTDEDLRYLRMAGDLLDGQEHEVIDKWRGIIGSQPHLAHYFVAPDGEPDDTYKARVKERFARWVLDVCRRPLDRDWLNYQHEIGLRHTHLKKNQTDNAATPPQLPLRYLIAFSAVVNDTIKPFLANADNSVEEIEAMHRAWCKAVTLTVTLWSRPYLAESEW